MVLRSYRGAGLQELWSGNITELASAGGVLAVRLDTDEDHDVAVFDQDNGELLRVENTGSGWEVRYHLSLPAGIQRVAAGDLGANSRDELLFLGDGLVEVVSVDDFDFSDVRFLSGAPHGAAAFGDFDDDGDGDVAISSVGSLELWTGDGSTTISLSTSTTVGGQIVDVAALDWDGDGVLEVAALTSEGLVTVFSGASLAVWDQQATAGDALRLLGGDLDGDGDGDVVVVGADGSGHLWRHE